MRSLLPFLIAAALLPACRADPEAAEAVLKKIGGLEEKLRSLEQENVALRTETRALRTQLLGAVPERELLALAPIGGSGGRLSFTRVCPRDHYVVALNGRALSMVAALEVVCAEGSALGLAGAKQLSLERAGGVGGREFRRPCPAGQVADGLTGSAGALIDGFALRCRPFPRRVGSPAPASDARPERLPVAGGEGGAPYARTCPEGSFMAGLSGSFDRWLVNLTVHCSPALWPGDHD